MRHFRGGLKKSTLRTYANLMTTMMLGSLWHGASWTFVAWGALHGGFLAAERWLAKHFGGGTFWKRWGPRFVLALITYFLVNIIWVFFRAQDFAGAWGLVLWLIIISQGQSSTFIYFQF